MARFAEGTTVKPEASRQEIENTLRRYGADAFAAGYEGGKSWIMFRAHGRYVRFSVAMPRQDDDEFAVTPGGRRRDADARLAAAEQEERRRWRALALAIKAKLEVVETGISTFEEEFLAHVVLPDGTQVGQWLEPQVQRAYETGEMPSLLPMAALTAGTGG